MLQLDLNINPHATSEFNSLLTFEWCTCEFLYVLDLYCFLYRHRSQTIFNVVLPKTSADVFLQLRCGSSCVCFTTVVWSVERHRYSRVPGVSYHRKHLPLNLQPPSHSPYSTTRLFLQGKV